MATESSSPPNPPAAGGTPQNSATETVQPANEVKQDAAPQNPKSVFVNSEPIREDQVQNAVKFLSHPKVRDSPVFHRRNFLEKKGLTKEEIDEAFRRVPDPSPSAQPTVTNQVGQGVTTSTIQPTSVSQTPVPIITVPSSASSSMFALARSRFQWYHAVFAVSLLAASGAGTAIWVKKSMIPRLKSWIRWVVMEEKNGDGGITNIKPTLAEEAAAAAKAAAAAASDVAKASQEMMISRYEEKVNMEKFMDLMQMQVKEIRSMGSAIKHLEGRSDKIERTHLVEHGGHSGSITNLKPTYPNGHKPEIDSHSARSSLPPTSADKSAPPHPNSYMDIMAMVQRGERPPNIRDINDQPPNPNQQISNPRLAPRSKPWEGAYQAKTSSRGGFGSALNGEGGSDFGAQNNEASNQVDAQSTVPWWQKKNSRITETEYVEAKPGSTTVVQTNEQPPIQRTWVPPQPPPVAMPEAAEAIRRPKSKKEAEPVSQETSGEGFSAAEVTDELQRITKISESGGEVEEMHSGGQETNGGLLGGLKLSEIEEEPVQSY
ncbi:unnamed protein product [Linum tenue]|uniref:Peroxisomal membrane protein PEX14 n=1 Tax=Linum tenue TaxID=586396 RepID=A0AAV0QWN0_9ROSI|nr:unnamed protein product [Linum tenue]